MDQYTHSKYKYRPEELISSFNVSSSEDSGIVLETSRGLNRRDSLINIYKSLIALYVLYPHLINVSILLLNR